MNFNLLHFESIDSTNTEAIKQAKSGAAEGLCVLARKQTAGRGRYGRTWESGQDAGLSFSIVLRPDMEMRFLPLITLMTAVAVFDTLLEFGLKPDIKWVNDILVNEKKIGGILAEAVETPTGLAVIVGIGINLTSKNFPAELAVTATSIEAESGTHREANVVAQRLTGYLSYFYELLKKGNHSAIVDHWRQRSSYFSGTSVRVTLADSVIEGITDGLEENGALRIKLNDGSISIVQAGDVQRLRKSTN